ncbi:MAG TPA: diacylglycerol kinase family protein [Thermomicrobiales bacterium]|nr:diacylglycerol kinase family protein [Thermomicrobiales bacterium]
MSESRPLFVVNPSAGNGRATKVMAQAARAFRGPAEVVQTTGPGDAERLAQQGALEGFSPIVSVGGDGTVQEVVNGLMRSPGPPPLGIVPAGSGNDAARTLRLPKDPVEGVRLAWSDRQGAIDLGTCNGRYFLNVAGVGLDTKVAAAVNQRVSRLSRSRAGYIWQALLELRRYANPEFIIHFDDQVMTSRCLLIAVANLRYFAGGMKICPQADPADGWLDVCIGGDLSHLETLVLMPAIFVGQHGRHHKVTFHRVKTMRIECPAGLDVQLDGEIVDTLPAEFKVVPRALRVMGWHPDEASPCV